jgi:outer membrane protein
VKRNVIIALAAALTGFASLASAEIKIGVVNTDRLLSESPQYIAAQQTINAEFGPRQAEIRALDEQLQQAQQTLQKDGPTMTEMQRASREKDLRSRSTELARKQSAAEEDFNARRDEEMTKLQTLLRNEIAVYAKANGFDLILVSGVGYTSAAIDVTNPLLDALKKKAGVATTAPAATPAPAAPKAPAAPATKPPAAPAK